MTLHLVKTDAFEDCIEQQTDEPAYVCAEGVLDRAYHYWSGISGNRYLHTVYSLLECPELPEVNCIFVRREENGNRTAIKVSRTCSQTESVNLAYMRYHAARLGANEVHVHMLAETPAEQVAVLQDITKAQFSKITARMKAHAANAR